MLKIKYTILCEDQESDSSDHNGFRDSLKKRKVEKVTPLPAHTQLQD